VSFFELNLLALVALADDVTVFQQSNGEYSCNVLVLRPVQDNL